MAFEFLGSLTKISTFLCQGVVLMWTCAQNWLEKDTGVIKNCLFALISRHLYPNSDEKGYRCINNLQEDLFAFFHSFIFSNHWNQCYTEINSIYLTKSTLASSWKSETGQTNVIKSVRNMTFALRYLEALRRRIDNAYSTC